MSKKFLLLIITCLSFAYTITAQDKLMMNILQVTIDGVDYSDTYIENEVVLMLYEDEGKYHFANVWKESSSYGEIIPYNHDHYQEPESFYNVDEYNFRWKYQNTYDDKTGSCLIKLLLIHRATNIAFELRMIQENGSIAVYKGYVDGTLDIEKYMR